MADAVGLFSGDGNMNNIQPTVLQRPGVFLADVQRHCSRFAVCKGILRAVGVHQGDIIDTLNLVALRRL